MVTEDDFKKGLTSSGYVPEAVNDQALLDEIAKLEQFTGDLRDRLEANRKEYTSLYQDFES